MADPGRFQYNLDGQGITFVNSNDNKIIIRSDAPTVSIDDSGIERPPAGSLSLAGQAPRAIGIIEPSTGALAFAGTIPVFNQPIPVPVGSLSFSGNAPSLGSIVLPPAVTVSITEYDAERPTGLKLESESPTTVVATVELPTTGSMAFASDPPDVESSSSTVINRLPQRKRVNLTGYAPTSVVANVVLPTLDTLTIQGRLTNVFKVAYPTKAGLSLAGQAPDVIGEGQVGVIIEGPFEYGTFIRNTTATTDVPVNYQIDDRTGFKVKVKDVLIEEYTGHMVRPDHLDKRSEQEFLKSKRDGGKGPQRPEPVGNERHIDEEYPDGVSSDDL